MVELLACELPRDLNINETHVQEFNRTALMLAAHSGHANIIEILLRHQDINLDMQDSNGMTALYLATRRDDDVIVEQLLKAGASVDITDFQALRSPLRLAAERDLGGLVSLFLEHGADPYLQDLDGGTAMLRAVNQGCTEALEVFARKSIDLDCVDQLGQSLLHGACRYNYPKIVERLIGWSLDEKEISPSIRDKFGMTPLHDACQYGHEAVVMVLLSSLRDLEMEADQMAQDSLGRTPFDVAWQYGHDNIVSILKDANAAPQKVHGSEENVLPVWSLARRGLTDLLGSAITLRPEELNVVEPRSEKSPLHCAVEDGQLDALEQLLNCKLLSINKMDYYKRTALHASALKGDTFASQLLIKSGANVNAKDHWGDEPLVVAQSNKHNELMLALIEAGAAINKQKIKTEKLFFFAVEQGRVSAVRVLLEKHGVDRSVQNENGLRAKQIAEAAEDVEMMRILNAAATVNFQSFRVDDKDIGRRDNRQIKFVPFRSRNLGHDID